ncbi:transcription elongation factor GreA [Candidatus Roizmanbacteria bacterium CG_4_10_14_0_8_um_filter_39_9]|uniref:Transcription elongation factor GreA n=1 Tax=Candidatus Roizmanbacteria bacterium CG_4_10_14_0_8_um_filter_39_9 TaxID=1974829 RepID=A0A2M7QDW4_9BACT|nr:MAG: transcription elongation factor GreA [Candidatus Roizmanbacteria bacterium CG_4_10_14_0_8_um_filter_39_9]
MQQKKIEITKQGIDALCAELKKLQETDRPVVLEKLHKARSMGDLSENSAYTTAREEQSMLEGRISEINYILKNASVLSTNTNNLIVSVGSKIKVDIVGNLDTVEIVGEYEADPMNKRLSSTSPIAQALLGKKVGDIIDITVPSGKIIYTIKEIYS